MLGSEHAVKMEQAAWKMTFWLICRFAAFSVRGLLSIHEMFLGHKCNTNKFRNK